MNGAAGPVRPVQARSRAGAVQDRDRFFTSIHNAFTAVGLGQMDAPTALAQAEQEINQMIDEVAGP